MVGEKESCILRSRKDSARSSDSDTQQGTYCKWKKEKKTKFQTDDTPPASNGQYERNLMVDVFVQDVIERAKNEYLSQCANGEQDVFLHEGCHDNARTDRDGENGRLVNDESAQKSGKGKNKRHKHHYKYSDPVDAKEISEYEDHEANALLEKNPHPGEANTRSRRASNGGVYNRTVAAFRRLICCCFGKT